MSDRLDGIRAVDTADQLGDVLGLPDQLPDALWRVETAGIEPFEATGLAVCGMGGSGIGGSLAAAAIGDRLSRPVLVVRDYELPSWTPAGHAVLCMSYSGNTEETLACFAAAEALGVKRVVATTGGALAEAARAAGVPVVGIPSGLQPRAAVGYMFAIAAELAALIQAADGIRTEIDAAAAWLAEQVDALAARSADIAAELAGAVPVVYGCDLTSPVAYRWKTQINENAKQPAFNHELPELDHNEIVAWDASFDGGPFVPIFLEDSDQHPRERERAQLTARLIEPGAKAVLRIETEGPNRTARMLWGVMLGDLVSLHMAAGRNVDPSPVQVIERLKDELGRP
ncbi:MAG: bifunctional phosphoglucose/phosphomannose isomerase [Solirubrobacterales bacterium]